MLDFSSPGSLNGWHGVKRTSEVSVYVLKVSRKLSVGQLLRNVFYTLYSASKCQLQLSKDHDFSTLKGRILIEC